MGYGLHENYHSGYQSECGTGHQEQFEITDFRSFFLETGKAVTIIACVKICWKLFMADLAQWNLQVVILLQL